MKARINIKYFPFTPGLPWKMCNKFVCPRMPMSLLLPRLENKNVTAIAYGGLFETFCSLYILETINELSPSSNLYWEGDLKYKDIINYNGLAKISKNIMGKDIYLKYPTPMFLDNDNNCYFNCLYNYKKMISYDLINIKANINPMIKQLVNNNLIGYNDKYIPKLRLLNNCKKELETKMMLSKISLDKFFVLIFPEHSKFTIHNKDCLKWNASKVKSLVSLLKQNNIQSIIMTDYPGKYYEFSNVLPMRFDYILYLLNKANVVISSDIDYLLIGIMYGAAVASHKYKKMYRIYKNSDYIGKNINFVKYKLEPAEVFNFVKKVRD